MGYPSRNRLPPASIPIWLRLTRKLEKIEKYGRYQDVDGDGICYRTIPGTHPTKGSFFTRGTSRDEYAKYTEDGEVYVRIVDRLHKKWETAKKYVPAPKLYQQENRNSRGIIFFGTSTYAALEAMELLEQQGIVLDALRVKAFPFDKTVENFIEEHEQIFVIEFP